MPIAAPSERPINERSASARNCSSRRWRATMVALSAVSGRLTAVHISTGAASALPVRDANSGASSQQPPSSTALRPSVAVNAVS